MPVIPPPPANNYDDLSVALNMARVRLNDQLKTLDPISGLLLNDTNAFTQQTTNSAWRLVQDELANRGYNRLISETIVGPMPIVANMDPASQCWLGFDGCFDGYNFFQTPRLPDGFNHPIVMWERQSGINMVFPRTPMEKILNGIPSFTKSTGNGLWEWREDRIYFPGSLIPEDFRIRYTLFLNDFLDVGSVQWFQQKIPIMRAADALAWFIAAEHISARGDNQVAEICWKSGRAAVEKVFNSDVRADQQVNIRRQSSSGYGPGYGRGRGYGWW